MSFLRRAGRKNDIQIKKSTMLPQAKGLRAKLRKYRAMHTESLPGYIDRATTRPRTTIMWVGLATLLVLGAALLPRVLGLADFFTIDEADHWILRVRLFSEALGQHNWAGTNLTGHPGVMTMWLGGLGRRLA